MQVFDGQERRQWPRAPSKLSRLIVWTDSTVYQEAEVLDESLTGISLLVSNGGDFHRDQQVRLAYGSQEAPAMVKHVDRRPDGRYHVGLEWGPSEIGPACWKLLLAQLGEATLPP
jgi:hypothetical protein